MIAHTLRVECVVLSAFEIRTGGPHSITVRLAALGFASNHPRR